MSSRHDADNITGIVYARNTQRVVIPTGPNGPLGDQVIASGLLYRKPTDQTPIGTFDLSAITTSAGDTTERRQVFIELALDNTYLRRSPFGDLRRSSSRRFSRSDINLAGVETYPIGGGILQTPLRLGVSTGTGTFLRADGLATITYDDSSQIFTYDLNLFNC